MALYQPRRAVIATVLANLMQAEFAEGSTTIAIISFSLSLFLAKLCCMTEKLSCTIIYSFKWQKLSSAIMSSLNMSKLNDS